MLVALMFFSHAPSGMIAIESHGLALTLSFWLKLPFR